MRMSLTRTRGGDGGGTFALRVLLLTANTAKSSGFMPVCLVCFFSRVDSRVGGVRGFALRLFSAAAIFLSVRASTMGSSSGTLGGAAGSSSALRSGG